MLYRTLAIAAVALAAACNDPSGPEVGTFTANVTGARTLQLEGTSSVALVYTETRPQGSYTISMFDVAGNRTHFVQIVCPNTEFFQVRTYTLTADENECHARYYLTGTGQEVFTVYEEFISITGTFTVTAVTSTAVQGSFQFTGDLSADGQSNAPVTAAGVFNSVRQ